MPAQPPILDDRALKAILERLQALAGSDVPEWTPPPRGDAGTMLQRIFARLLELTLQRLNQAPEKNLLAFLDTMGVSVLPPAPAKVPLTFGLTAGTPATLVPQGMQAGTQSSGQQPAMIFETEDDLTVIPAQLTIGFTIDPTWDRYADQTAALAGQSPSGFTPFVGTTRMPHVLYLGDDTLLNFSRATAVEVKIAEGILPPAIQEFFRTLLWQYRSKGAVKTTAPTPVGPFQFTIADLIKQETIQGVGLTQGIQSRWLRAVLMLPFPDDPVARDLRLTQLKLKVSASGLLPDLAFSNTAPLDVTKDFFPFGEAPKVGDAFFIGSQEVFSRPSATVRLSVRVKPSPPPTLMWEYSSGNAAGRADQAWTQLPRKSIEDATKSFTQSGRIALSRPANMASTQVGGETAFWFRARIAGGNYRGAPHVDQFRDQTTLAEKVAAGQDTVRLTTVGFATQVAVLKVEDEFVRVVKVGQDTFQVTPVLLRGHSAGTPVERRGLSSPVATLLQQAEKGDNKLIVSPTEAIAVEDVLMIDDPATPPDEFIVVKDVQPRDNGFEILTVEPLRFTHAVAALPAPISLRHVTSDFFGFAEGERVDFTAPFFPFGEQSGPGNVFYFGTTTGFPPTIEIDVSLKMTLPNIQLTWDFLGANGWQPFNPTLDGTNAFLQDGDMVLPAQPVIAAEVNGQSSYWIRVRLAGGNYGLPIEFVAVDPDDPKLGFKVKPGTGNLNPPVITKLTLSYEAERAPIVLTQNGFLYSDQTSANTGDRFAPFVSVKDLPAIYVDPDPVLYLGFDAAFPEQPVTLYIATPPRAFAGSVVKETRAAPAPSSALAPLQWEYFNGTAWRELIVFDGTNNLTESGTLEFLTPADIAALAKFDLTARYWIRARSSENDPFDTQQVSGVFPNTIPAIQATTVQNETLGSSNGLPNQALRFARTPVLTGQQVMVREPEPPSDRERAAIEAEEGADATQARPNPVTGVAEIWVRWHAVPNFMRSDPHSRHYTLDHTAGLLAFGDGKRGQIPPRGTNNIAATYRAGGGAAGNAPKGAVAQVKSPLPGVASVTNPVAADGGAAVETVPMVAERGPQTLRHRDRAVACADLEWLARQAAGTRVARTKCLSNVNRDLRFEPGWVTLLIVPQGSEPQLSPGSELIREVEDYLAARMFVGLAQQTPARVNVIGPGYIQVAVTARVVPQDIDEAERVKQRVLAALAAFFHPLTGGPGGTGWEFGRDVYESEVSQVLEGLPGVSHVKTLVLLPNSAQQRLTFASAPTTVMDLPAGSAVMTTDRQKAALLAEPVPIGAPVERIAVKGFKEGDRVTKVLDLKVTSVADPGTTLAVTALDGTQLMSDAVGFPRGSLVTTFDGMRRSRLASRIPRGETVPSIDLEDATFSPGDLITVFYPFPMTITAVTMDATTLMQTLGIQPYETEVAIPAGSVLATLDNRVRLPLATDTSASQPVIAVQVRGFAGDDALTINRRDAATPPLRVTLDSVAPVDDIVYLDDNFLVYSGKHSITMVAER